MRIYMTSYSTDPYGTLRNIECSVCHRHIGQQRKLGGKFEFYEDRRKEEYVYCPYCAHKLNKDCLKENR